MRRIFKEYIYYLHRILYIQLNISQLPLKSRKHESPTELKEEVKPNQHKNNIYEKCFNQWKKPSIQSYEVEYINLFV